MKPNNIILEGSYDIMSIMKGYIYKHTSPSEKSYIGQTLVALKARWDSGHGYSSNTIFGKAIKKYGWKNFRSEVLHTVEHESSDLLVEKLNILEIQEILLNNTISPNGYNGTLGGRNGLRTEQQKKAISDTLSGRLLSNTHKKNISKALERRWENQEWRESFSSKMIEKHKDPDFRAKRGKSLSSALQGRSMSEEWRNKMSIAAKKRWEDKSLREAASRRAKNNPKERGKDGRFV